MEIRSFSPGTMQTSSSKAMWEAIRNAPKQELPAPKEYDFANPGPLKVEIIEPPEMHIEPMIDVDALGFTETETQKVETFIKDIQRDIETMGQYDGYKRLGTATSMVRYYAAHQLDAEKGQRLVDAFEEKVQSIIAEDRAQDMERFGSPDNNHAIKLVGNSFYYCNQSMKDTLYNLFSNLDITNEKTFEKTFETAVKKTNDLILSYKKDFDNERLNIKYMLYESTSLNDYLDAAYKNRRSPPDLNDPRYANMKFTPQVIRFTQEEWLFYDSMKQLHSQHSGMSFIHYLGTA